MPRPPLKPQLPLKPRTAISSRGIGRAGFQSASRQPPQALHTEPSVQNKRVKTWSGMSTSDRELDLGSDRAEHRFRYGLLGDLRVRYFHQRNG